MQHRGISKCLNGKHPFKHLRNLTEDEARDLLIKFPLIIDDVIKMCQG